ncbi:hypothetical protein A2165_03110, partial [Candidatus Curtissbacteria bacterium RBG_13_40_7]
MIKIPQKYLGLFAKRDFLVLSATLFLGQIASGFLLLSLISSVFTKTGSNFAVSGVVLSLAMPSFLLVAVAGLVADLVDRKKIIIISNFAIALVVFAILLSLEKVFASISLSFLYFAGNTFFLPAISAASAQLVGKRQLSMANSIFILALVGGQLFGLFCASIINFFFGNVITLIISEALLIICVLIPLALPRLMPRRDGSSIFKILYDIWRGFSYIFRAKTIWFFFLAFAFMPGITAFGATLGPGFFNDIVGVSISKSPLVIMPPVALGVLLGAYFVNKPKVRDSFFIAQGLGVLGISTAFLGLLISFDHVRYFIMFLTVVVFLICAGFGVIISLIAARTVLQRRVAHNYQGTVFGANI